MTVHVVIPARFGSTRLPGKPLVDIGGQPMVVRVAQQAARSVADDVVVAVDDQRVATAVEAAGFTAVLTDPEHTSGSDRSMQVAELMRWPDEDHIINVQGDEPLMPISVINALIEKLQALPTLEMATVSEPLEALDDFLDPNVVKVVADDSWHAMYFLEPLYLLPETLWRRVLSQKMPGANCSRLGEYSDTLVFMVFV